MAPEQGLVEIRGQMRVRVVGLSFCVEDGCYAPRLYRAIVRDEAPLCLDRRPGDGGDPNAIAVCREDDGEQLGYLRASTARILAPHLDFGELWIVAEADLQIVDGREASPGLMITIRRVEWADDPPARVVRLGEEPRHPDRGDRRPRQDIRSWAKKSTQLADREHLRASRVGEDHWAVPSSSQADRYYAVVADTDEHCLVHLLCNCRGATCRPELPVACKHAGAVVRALERSGEVRVIGNLAYRIPAVASVA